MWIICSVQLVVTMYCLSLFKVRRLDTLVHESEQGLGNASGHISSLKDASARVKGELDKTREELRMSKQNAASLQVRGHVHILYTPHVHTERCLTAGQVASIGIIHVLAWPSLQGQGDSLLSKVK
jgi:hypothetical protein